VDDHEDLCELMELYLEQAGFVVSTTRSTEGAWNILTRPAIAVDIMIADATLSEANDGLRLVARARLRFPRMRAIVLSGDVNVREKALSAGADAVLIKPVQARTLVTEVQRLVEQ
jgi:DNA-binding response OmpR family regulator